MTTGAAHPDIVRVRQILRDEGLDPPVGGDVAAVRAYLGRVGELTGRSSVPLAVEFMLSIDVGSRNVSCKLYWPDGAVRPPLMFYCHGGGFRHGELAGWDAPLRQIVRTSGAAILSIGYALSPEHPFPAAFDEVVAIARRVIGSGTIDGRDVDGFALGGDSSGANLALGAAIALRNAGVAGLRHLMLIYGVYSKDVERPSWRRLGGYGGHGLSAASMSTYWSTYTLADEDDWRVQPLFADLTGLPPASILIGDLDPLIDENIALADELHAVGGTANLTIVPGMIHGVMRFSDLAPLVRGLLDDAAADLRRAFD